MMKIHELKTLSKYFNEVAVGSKKFEVRKNDRDYKSGDILCLRDYDGEKKEYTGSYILALVVYVLQGGEFGIEKDHVVMSIERINTLIS